MVFKMKGYSAFTRKTDPPKKTYPKHYTKKDIKFLEEQNEDIVRKEDKPNIVIKYDNKGNMMHPKDWDPNYKSKFKKEVEKIDSLPKNKTKDGWVTIKRKKN